MKHLVGHFRHGLNATLQGEDTVIPEVVVQRSANVDYVELVLTVLVGKRRVDAVFNVTDARRSSVTTSMALRSAAVPSQSALTERSRGRT